MKEPSEDERMRRRELFAASLTSAAFKYELDQADVADSLTAVLVGIYYHIGLTEQDLHNRIRTAWATCLPTLEKMKP